MNALAILLSLFLPFLMCAFCCSLSASWLMYRRQPLAHALLGVAYVGCLLAAANAAWHRKNNPAPTWHSYLALMLLLAALFGTWLGLHVFDEFTKPYFSALDLKDVSDLDVDNMVGQGALDIGIATFKQGTHLDASRSWHFKHDTVYCVAPIVAAKNRSGDMPYYDFWAVGQDCCAINSPDFRCGDWSTSAAPGAIRAFDEDALGFYRLAVKQAETLHGVISSDPVFFRWSENPHETVNQWRAQGRRRLLLGVGWFLVFSLLAMLVATSSFALLGRNRDAEDDLDMFRELLMDEIGDYGT